MKIHDGFCVSDGACGFALFFSYVAVSVCYCVCVCVAKGAYNGQHDIINKM